MLVSAPGVWPLSLLVARPYSILDVPLDFQARFLPESRQIIYFFDGEDFKSHDPPLLYDITTNTTYFVTVLIERLIVAEMTYYI